MVSVDVKHHVYLLTRKRGEKEVGDRDRKRQRDRYREGQTPRERDRDRDRQTDRQTEKGAGSIHKKYMAKKH